MSESDAIPPSFRIGGDIAQACATAVGTAVPVTYFESAIPVTMVVNVFNASSACALIVRLEDACHRVLVSTTIAPRMAKPDPVDPTQADVENQAKTLMATRVHFLTVACLCTVSTCSGGETLCAGRYWGQVQPAPARRHHPQGSRNPTAV